MALHDWNLEELAEDRIEQCGGVGYWTRDSAFPTQPYSYKHGTPEDVAWALRHPAGSTIHDLALWVRTRRSITSPRRLYAALCGRGGLTEDDHCWHWLREVEELSEVVWERAQELWLEESRQLEKTRK